MLKSLFSAASPDFDVKQFAECHNIAEDDLWIRGQKGIRGPRTDSGFCLLAADSEELSEHLQQLDEFLLDFEEAIRELRQLTIPCMIDCGLTVGGKNTLYSLFRSPAKADAHAWGTRGGIQSVCVPLWKVAAQ